MRLSLLIIPLVVAAAPATAQPSPAPDEIQKQLADPATLDRLAEMMKALSTAFLDLPVGQVAAAVEGRPVTEADKRRTVGTESRLGERALKAQIDEARPAMQAGMKAMAAALPAMMKTMEAAQDEFERAAANMPRPDYPKR